MAALQRSRRANFPAISTLLSLVAAYAPQYTSVILFLTMFDLVPGQLLSYVVDAVRSYWKPKSAKLTLVFGEKDGMSPNQMFNAAEAFLRTRINPDSDCLRITKSYKEAQISIKFAESQAIEDRFEGILLAWKYVIVRPTPKPDRGGGDGIEIPERKHIELRFEKEHKATIINSYLPWIIKKAKELENQKKVVKLHNLQWHYDSYIKESVNLDHPSTFDTLAMDPKLKKTIIDDLDLFLKRRQFYKKVGKAWKRGYLLYGPPGTGKSSLIAAMANYLKFNIYDLQLNSVGSDSNLKKLMLSTSNRSIIVIEDIDCSIQSHKRDGSSSSSSSKQPIHTPKRVPQFSLSGLLNFIDGLWSCCGDERIIIFTTNHKNRLDPALLRPGRMDVHIHMSYLTFDGFKILAKNYLNIDDHHWRFTEIEELINGTNVTPAEVAEELMKSEDQEIVLEGLVNFLKLKKMEDDDKAKDRIEKDKDAVEEAE